MLDWMKSTRFVIEKNSIFKQEDLYGASSDVGAWA
jgi:hypothetical protein